MIITEKTEKTVYISVSRGGPSSPRYIYFETDNPLVTISKFSTKDKSIEECRLLIEEEMKNMDKIGQKYEMNEIHRDYDPRHRCACCFSRLTESGTCNHRGCMRPTVRFVHGDQMPPYNNGYPNKRFMRQFSIEVEIDDELCNYWESDGAKMADILETNFKETIKQLIKDGKLESLQSLYSITMMAERDGCTIGDWLQANR